MRLIRLRCPAKPNLDSARIRLYTKAMTSHRGRGSVENPPNRFIPLQYVADPDCPPDDAPAPHTRFFRDASRSIIASNDSPDIGFSHSVNPYRGCEHGCSYCYARPYHEYLGLSSGLDFESQIFVKEDAPELLRKEFMAKSWQPTCLLFSGVTDSYQPIERKLEVTRRCLQVCAEFRNPVGIVTKNALVTRDADILADLAADNASIVFISLTTLDPELAGKLEPRASRPAARLEAIATLRKAGIPVGVMTAPMIPGLNDHELPALLSAAKDAGAQFAAFTMVRLPMAVGSVFAEWLDRHYPDRKEKVLGRIRELHEGRLNDVRFGKRMSGDGEIASATHKLFRMTKNRLGFTAKPSKLNTSAFRRPGERSLFDG